MGNMGVLGASADALYIPQVTKLQPSISFKSDRGTCLVCCSVALLISPGGLGQQSGRAELLLLLLLLLHGSGNLSLSAVQLTNEPCNGIGMPAG